MSNCTGNGSCLEQIDLNEYTSNDCPHNCQPIPCINYEFCNRKLPQRNIDLHPPYCHACGYEHSHGTLQFRDTTSTCCICMEQKGREMKFPPCSHWFCVDCCKSILWWDETKYQLSPVPFGCPPCPNGCQNPERGPQCNCYVYTSCYGVDEIGPLSVVQAWERDNPEAYRRWNEVEVESIIRGNINGEVWGTKKCPLCRRQ